MPPYEFWEKNSAVGLSPSNRTDAGVYLLAEFLGARGVIYIKDEDGLYTVKLTVTDDDGASDNENVLLTVTNANPSANAGGPYAVAEGSSIQLNGSGDDLGNNDDAGLTFAWTIDDTSIDTGGDCTLSGAATREGRDHATGARFARVAVLSPSDASSQRGSTENA